MLKIVTESNPAVSDVERIEIRVTPPQKRHDVPAPKTGLQGKFSLNYVTASALLDKQLTIRTFQDDAVDRPGIRAILDKIEVIVDETLYTARTTPVRRVPTQSPST